MNKFLLGFIALLLSVPAAAQQDQSGSESPSGGPQGGTGQNHPKFQEVKQHMLDRISERLNALQDHKNCVEQAQDMQALKACRPPQREEGNPGK